MDLRAVDLAFGGTALADVALALLRAAVALAGTALLGALARDGAAVALLALAGALRAAGDFAGLLAMPAFRASLATSFKAAAAMP